MNLKTITKLAASVSLLAGLSSTASASVPSGDVYIKKISYNGSGCPRNSVNKNVSSDKKAFTLTFSEYIAEAGPGLSLRDGRKNCQVTVDLKVPQGWQFSIGTFDYRGFVYLENSGIRATHNTSYYFQGQGRTGRFSETMRGFKDDYYHYREQVGLESYVWSTCNSSRALNINTSISVKNYKKRRNPDAEGIIGTDSLDGSIKQIWGLRWRRC